jgi:hypothetical protein
MVPQEVGWAMDRIDVAEDRDRWADGSWTGFMWLTIGTGGRMNHGQG